MFYGITIFVLNFIQIVSSQPSADQWHIFEDALYLVDNDTRLNYDQAQSYCQELGGNLARIDSDEIQSFLTDIVSPGFVPTRCFFIGANDIEDEGDFKWQDGTQVRYDGWSPGQPDDTEGNRDCACLWSSKNPSRHGQWDDTNCFNRMNFICQKRLYNFTLTSSRSNPGSGYVTCAVDIVDDNEILPPDDIRLSVGKTLASTRSIPYSSTRVIGQFRDSTFEIDNLEEDDMIFCHVGYLSRNTTSFSRIQFLPIKFYALPGLTFSPAVDDIGSTSLTVTWSSWIPCLDTGEGPVVSYLVYVKTTGKELINAGEVDSDEGEGALHGTMELALTELEPGTEYNISVSAVREGVGGEGPRSPFVSVTTSIVSARRSAILENGILPWIFFGVSLAGNVLLLVVIIKLWRRKKEPFQTRSLKGVRTTPSGSVPNDHQYEIPRARGDGEDHLYEGLRRKSSKYSEAEGYISMDGPDRVEYVNTIM
nr:uncharacterized protein LOC129271085 isoform X2 [Lytechinus pictus]